MVRPVFCYCDEEDTASHHVRFTPYFDAPLNTFITGPGHKKRILKERGLIEVGGEFKNHIMGKNLTPKEPLTTVDEVRAKLSEIKQKMADPAYRHQMENAGIFQKRGER